MADNEVKKWKKITYIEAKIEVIDWFYARTPDLRDTENYPFTNNAKYRITNIDGKRSTVEEIDLEKEKNEEISEETTASTEAEKDNKE